MPLSELVLDDRRFSDLVTGLRDLVPGQSRNWNDFNPSDPGMTLLELWCWIAEMLLYRMNRVSRRSRLNFLKLVLDPPEPVTAVVTLRVLGALGPVAIPPGIRFMAMVSPPEALEFETFETTFAGENLSPPDVIDAEVRVRSRVVVENEFLGVSDGSPHQIFYLKEGPVLTDENNTGVLPGDYNPNPRIAVNGDIWRFVPDFLESAGGAALRRFMVEKLTGGVRFGDGISAAIPPAGARITALSYQIVRGKEVRIGPDTLMLIDPIPWLAPGSIQDVRNRPAEGGDYVYPAEEAESTGLQLFEQEWRAVTDSDFETALVKQFNRAQESVPNPPTAADLIERLFIVADKDLRGSPPFSSQAGLISVVIMPKPLAATDVMLAPGEALVQRVKNFLDARRLITTRIAVTGPSYKPITLSVEAAGEAGIDVARTAREIDRRIRAFLHPLTGGDAGTGWPVGRDLHKSELYQQVESVDGVDFVRSIVLEGDPSRTSVPLNDKELPVVLPLSGQIPVSITI